MQRLVLALLSLFGYESAAGYPTSFNISAIATRDNASVIECWQLATSLTISMQNGIVGAAVQEFGLMEKASIGYLPAQYAGTPHPAPVVQYVAYLSGECEVTIPGSSQRAIFAAGGDSLIIAADTSDQTSLGHISSTLEKPMAAFMVPIRGGGIPDHKVLYDGQCRPSELQLLYPDNNSKPEK